MKLTDQATIVQRLQSIALLAVGVQEYVGSSANLDKLRSAIEDIRSDVDVVEQLIVPDESDPQRHPFKAAAGFSECCVICGEHPNLHD